MIWSILLDRNFLVYSIFKTNRSMIHFLFRLKCQEKLFNKNTKNAETKKDDRTMIKINGRKSALTKWKNIFCEKKKLKKKFWFTERVWVLLRLLTFSKIIFILILVSRFRRFCFAAQFCFLKNYLDNFFERLEQT